MKLIKLSGKYGAGKYAMVDDEDYEELNKYKWSACNPYKNIFYAKRTITRTENGKQMFEMLLMHRYILNCKGKERVDHADGNTLNNQKNNIRIATISQNNANRSKYEGYTSKYLGVYLFKNKYWRAACKKDGKIHIKSCKTEIQAALEYNKMASEYHGEFAKLNII